MASVRIVLAIALVVAAGGARSADNISPGPSAGTKAATRSPPPSFGPYSLGAPMKNCGQEVFMQELYRGTGVLSCTYVDPIIDDLRFRRIDLSIRRGILKGIVLMTKRNEKDAALEATLNHQWGPATRTDKNGTAEWNFPDGSKGVYEPALGWVSLSAGDILGGRPQRIARPPRIDPSAVEMPAGKLLAIGPYRLGAPLLRCPPATHLERTWPSHPEVLACDTSVSAVGPLPADRLVLTAVDRSIVEIRVFPNRDPQAGAVDKLPEMTNALTELLGPGKESDGESDSLLGDTVTWTGSDQFVLWNADDGRLRITRPGFEGAGSPLSPDPRNRQKSAAAH